MLLVPWRRWTTCSVSSSCLGVSEERPARGSAGSRRGCMRLMALALDEQREGLLGKQWLQHIQETSSIQHLTGFGRNKASSAWAVGPTSAFLPVSLTHSIVSFVDLLTTSFFEVLPKCAPYLYCQIHLWIWLWLRFAQDYDLASVLAVHTDSTVSFLRVGINTYLLYFFPLFDFCEIRKGWSHQKIYLVLMMTRGPC